MNIPGLTTAFRAQGTIGRFRLTTHGTQDGSAVQGAGSTKTFLGASTDLPAQDGRIIDVVRTGLAPVELGGNVERGQPLTADADGRAVAVVLPVAAHTYIAGFAEISGAEGDIGSIHLQPGVIPATA